MAPGIGGSPSGQCGDSAGDDALSPTRCIKWSVSLHVGLQCAGVPCRSKVYPMKIRDVKTYRLDAVLAEPFAYSQAWYNHRGALLVEILGEDGSSGC